MKKIAILGASGCVGFKTLEIIKKRPDLFSLVGISIYSQIEKLDKILEDFKELKIVAVKKLSEIKMYIAKYSTITFVEGDEGLESVAACNCDLLVNALVGFVGLKPTIKAIECGTNIALANKETLVVAGEIIMPLAKANKVKIFPIDSEHSAIFQCLEKSNKLQKVIITASGGPFYKRDLNELSNITVSEALNHPTWKMGAKITIDCSTMVNKAFEMLEAKWLFSLKPEQIETIIHPSSIVHSFVVFKDGSIKAQLGVSDMNIPIAYALSYPKRLENIAPELNLANLSLNFYKLDEQRFKPVGFAKRCMKEAGTLATVFNRANEVAVEYFLNNTIKYDRIIEIIEKTMSAHNNIMGKLTLDKILEADIWAKTYALNLIKEE